MPRLLRPAIPVETKCRVALHQLGEMWPDAVIDAHRRNLGRLLRGLLDRLGPLLGCEAAGLHLDHNPALAVRKKVMRKGVHVGYRPDANDPEHLIYREKHAHHIKTQVRGDGAQFPDRVLIKRERRREKRLKTVDFLKKPPDNKFKGKSKWPKRSFPKSGGFSKCRPPS